MARVTVVNDNPEFLALVHDILEDDRYEATTSTATAPTRSTLCERPGRTC